MPTYELAFPNGKTYQLDAPTDLTPDELAHAAATIQAPAPADAPTEPHPYLGTAARVGLPIAGAIAGGLSPIPGGTYLGGGLGGAGGEALAQWLNGLPIDPKEVALQGGLAAVPFVGKAATPLGGALLRGTEGAVLGASGSALRDWLHNRSLDRQALLQSAGLGGVLGGAGGALEGTLARRAALRTVAPPIVADVPEVPVAAAPAALDFPPPFPVERPPPPSLGTMGLPGAIGLQEAPEVGALSAREVNTLAPSIIDQVQTTDDVKALVHNLAGANTSMIEEARRGVQTAAQREAAAAPIVAELAHRLGEDPDTFAQTLRARGEAVNAEQMQALKSVFTSVTGDFYDVAHQVAAGDTDPQTLLRMTKAMNLAKGVLAQKAGAVAEAGRALNALRGTQSMERLQGRALEALLSKAGTSESLLTDIAQRAASLDMQDPVALTRFLRGASEATTADKVFEFWLNARLSGPQTHIINNASNALALGMRGPEAALSGSLDALRATVTGTPRQRFAGEAVADLLGLTRGLQGGARAAMQAYRTEAPVFGAARIEQRPFMISGGGGRLVRNPTRLLLAADEFWKAVSLEGGIYGQAYRQAALEGTSGTARLARMAALIDADREGLAARAMPDVLNRVFQSPSRVATGLIHARENAPGSRYVFPFIRTPVNVMTFGAERTPFGVASIVKKLRQGAPGGEVSDAVAKVLLGSGIGAGVVATAAHNITGAPPRDRGKLNALRLTGWQPYSIRIGSNWYSYDRLEPVGSMLAFAANAAEALRDPLISPDEIASHVTGAFARRVVDQTFMTGLRQVMDAVEDFDRSGRAYLKRVAASFIPTAVSNLTKFDPIRRDPGTTIGGFIQSQIPGLASDLPPLRNVWGEPVLRGDTGFGALVTPMNRSPISEDDPASVEVARLVTAAGLSIDSPARVLVRNKTSIPLTPEQYDQYSERAGALAHQFVSRLVALPRYQGLPDDRRAKLLSHAVSLGREQARREMRRTATPLPLGVVGAR